MTHSISLSPSGSILLSIPSPAGTQTVSVPMSLDGLRLIKKVLEAKTSVPDPRLGSWAEPTQYMTERWLVEDREKKVNEKYKKIANEIQLEF